MIPDPRFLATAVEAVVRAGDIHLSRFRQGVRIDKKGAIDIVTEVDLEVERMFRAMIAERFPAHDVLAEELGGEATGASHRWVFDPLDGTTNYAHGLPIFCASLALEIDGEAAVAAVYDPTRQELFTAERGVGAWLNGEPLRVSATDMLLDALLVTGFPYRVQEEPRRYLALFEAFIMRARPCGGSDRRRSTSATSRPAAWTASGKSTSTPGTPAPARSSSWRPAAASPAWTAGRGCPRTGTSWRATAPSTRRCWRRSPRRGRLMRGYNGGIAR